MEAPVPGLNQDEDPQELSGSEIPTIPCLRGERRTAEAQRASALWELEDLRRAEEEHKKKKHIVKKWDYRLAKRQIKIEFKLKLAQETLKILDEPKTNETNTANTIASVEQRDEEILEILE